METEKHLSKVTLLVWTDWDYAPDIILKTLEEHLPYYDAMILEHNNEYIKLPWEVMGEE